VLRVGLSGAPDSLDPAIAQFATAAILLNQLHAPLDSYRPGQGLVESWEAEADGAVWRATLREGLQWSDGAPLTADEIVWNVQQAAGPGSVYSGVGDLLPLKGAADASLGLRPVTEIGVSAPDARTVVFELAEPLGVFPETMREFYPRPRHAIEAHGPDWVQPENFVCAGPYLLTRSTQLSMSLARNPRYFASGDVALAAVEVEAVEDEAARLRMFRAGDLDLAQDPPLQSVRVLGDEMHVYDAPRLTYLKPNHASPVLGDARVRRALSLAVDREFIASALFADLAAPAPAIIPASPNADPRGRAERQEEARALVEAAGAAGAELELLQSGGEREGIAVTLADDWAAIGIETTISRTDDTGLYAAVDEGRFDLALARFDRGLKTAPWRYLEPFAPGGFAANFNWRAPDLSAALAEIRAEPDAERRAALAFAAERAVLEEAALIPLLHERAGWLSAGALRDSGTGQPLFWANLSFR